MASSRKTHAGSSNAIDLLIDDHENVKKLFKQFDKIKDKADAADKQALVEQICTELRLHTEIEEEIFYPAARQATGDDDMINEAEVEHGSAKDLISQLEVMDPADEMYDAKVTVLSEYIDHHVEEEEKEMFPKVKKAKVDLEALGAEMQTMKETRQAQMMPAAGVKPKSGRAPARH